MRNGFRDVITGMHISKWCQFGEIATIKLRGPSTEENRLHPREIHFIYVNARTSSAHSLLNFCEIYFMK